MMFQHNYRIVQPSPSFNLRTLSSPSKKKKPLHSLAFIAQPLSSPTQIQAVTNLLTVSVGFPLLEPSYEWNHTCSPLWLAPSSWPKVFSIHLCSTCVSTAFFLRTEEYSSPCLYHTVLTHSSVGGHLGDVHFEVIINNATMKFLYEFLCEHVFSLVWGRYRQKEGPDHVPGPLSHLSKASSCCLLQKLS